MREKLELGSAPSGEDCVQVTRDGNYTEAMRTECRIYKEQLERMFPNPPGEVYFTIKSNPHDFGTYYEVAVVFNPENEEEANWAYMVEENCPLEWDDEALRARIEARNAKKPVEGTPPTRTCDICMTTNLPVYIDGATAGGRGWANMCENCHNTHGVGLGIGRGQKYEWQGSRYVEVEGGK